MDNAERSESLLRLARACGVGTEYWAFDGTERHVAAATLIKVLGALGIDASTPTRVELALLHVEDDAWREPLPPTVVAREGQAVTIPVHVPDGTPVSVWIDLDPEAGGGRREARQVDNWDAPRRVDGRMVGRASFEIPGDLPLGWHTLRSRADDGEHVATLIVTPQRLRLPESLEHGRAWGLMSQMYSVRSSRSWGIGDFADLAETSWFAGRDLGADFMLINPVHAGEPAAPMTPSPYLPVTRRFVNPIYVRPEAVEEAAYLSAADRSLVEWAAEEAQTLNSSSGPIDRDLVWTHKRSALEVIFAAPRSAIREAQLADFREREGKGLEDFALWCALKEIYPTGEWPDELWDYSSPEVAKARVELAERVDFYVWLQWVADQQLAAAQAAAKAGGMSLGIMHDLAVGVHPEGSDAWSLKHALATGASVGAPPDMYNQQGQDWSQPPWHPKGLARVGYQPYREMLRTVLRHAGAIRIDHVIGLFRLWWIPAGSGAQDGAYVRYDHDAIIGILCLEAQRAGAVVIGEDLGTFEGWVRDYLTDRGILGTSILWFEKDYEGRPLAPEHYRAMSLTSVTTHDLPPTAGYLAGEHVELRESLGLLQAPVHEVRAEARAERDDMVRLLAGRGLLGDDPSERELVEALHRLIKLTPSKLLGVSLADAVGERRAQNQPGTDQEYPNWKIPLGDPNGVTVLLDDLVTNPRLRSLAAAMNQR